MWQPVTVTIVSPNPFRKTPLVDSLVASSPSQPSPEPTRGTAVLLTVGRRSGRCCGVRARTRGVHPPMERINNRGNETIRKKNFV